MDLSYFTFVVAVIHEVDITSRAHDVVRHVPVSAREFDNVFYIHNPFYRKSGANLW